MNINFRNLKVAEMRQASKLCERMHYITPNESFGNHLHVVMQQAFNTDHFTYDRFSLSDMSIEESVNDTVDAHYYPIFATYQHQHPLFQIIPKIQTTMTCSFLTEMSSQEYRQTELYNEVYKHLNVEDQLVIGLNDGQSIHAIAYSKDVPFAENEHAILHLVRPHLETAWKNWSRIRELEERVKMLEEKLVVSEETEKNAASAKLLMDRLTKRQRAVAELVAQGLENRAIAETLHIAPKTVNKHLENIFQSLQIHHRAELAATWSLAK